jgi:endonuclease-8
MLDADGLLRHRYLAALGPDLLDPALHWRDLAQRLNAPAFRNRGLGALYLDQGFVAGLGNYPRSETLFAAGLHPAPRPRDLDLKGRNRLARTRLEIGTRAYLSGGVTSKPQIPRGPRVPPGRHCAAPPIAIRSRPG